jgi:hypothetical protein
MYDAFDGSPRISKPDKLKRRFQQATLTEMAPRFTSIDVDGFYLPHVPHDANKYDHLSDMMYGEHVGLVPPASLIGGGVQHGFFVACRLLSYAPPTYRRHKEQISGGSGEGDIAELAEILKRSAHIPNFFASLSRKYNMVYEEVFGLQPSLRAAPETFKIHQVAGQAATFETVDWAMKEADRNIEPIRRSDVETYEFCPARGAFINQIWRTAIDHCVENPAFFAADLGSAQPA